VDNDTKEYPTFATVCTKNMTTIFEAQTFSALIAPQPAADESTPKVIPNEKMGDHWNTSQLSSQ